MIIEEFGTWVIDAFERKYPDHYDDYYNSLQDLALNIQIVVSRKPEFQVLPNLQLHEKFSRYRSVIESEAADYEVKDSWMRKIQEIITNDYNYVKKVNEFCLQVIGSAKSIRWAEFQNHIYCKEVTEIGPNEPQKEEAKRDRLSVFKTKLFMAVGTNSGDSSTTLATESSESFDTPHMQFKSSLNSSNDYFRDSDSYDSNNNANQTFNQTFESEYKNCRPGNNNFHMDSKNSSFISNISLDHSDLSRSMNLRSANSKTESIYNKENIPNSLMKVRRSNSKFGKTFNDKFNPEETPNINSKINTGDINLNKVKEPVSLKKYSYSRISHRKLQLVNKETEAQPQISDFGSQVNQPSELEHFLKTDKNINGWCDSLKDTYANINQIKSFSTSLKRKNNSQCKLGLLNQDKSQGTFSVRSLKPSTSLKTFDKAIEYTNFFKQENKLDNEYEDIY